MSDGAGWPTEADYAWADERDAFCVSFVEATSPEAVLDKMVGGCRTGILSVAEARKWVSEQTVPLYGSAVEAGMVGAWVVTFEANGYQATLPEVLRIGRVSKGSQAIVVVRRFGGQSGFLYAVDGAVVRSFDPVRYGAPTAGGGPPLLRSQALTSVIAIRWLRRSHARSASPVSASAPTCSASTATGSQLPTTPCVPSPAQPSAKADDVDGAREAAVSSPGQSGTRGDGILKAIALLCGLGLRLFLGGGESGSDAPSPVQAVAVAPASGPKGTTVEITGGPCPAVPEGKQPFGIEFGLHDLRAEVGRDFPAMGAVPLIPGEPWEGLLQIPEGTPAGRYTAYARCVVTEAEGTGGTPFHTYENSTFEVVEP